MATARNAISLGFLELIFEFLANLQCDRINIGVFISIVRDVGETDEAWKGFDSCMKEVLNGAASHLQGYPHRKPTYCIGLACGAYSG